MFTLISKKTRLNSNETCLYLYQIINAVEYLYLNKISHRDLKPENILLSSYSTLLKVIDFGLATETIDNSELSTQCGSPNYSSPEMMKGNKYDGHLVDIWSIGIIAFVMICGYLPFEDSNEKNLIKKITKGKYDFPHYTPFIFRDFIKKTLMVNPRNRMTISQMKEHTVYKHGKALFFREIIIYQENNRLDPIIHEEIQKRTINYIISNNINKNIDQYDKSERENDPIYKIVYDKILTGSNWKKFLLEINDKDIGFNCTEKKENEIISPQDIIRRLRMLNINDRYKSSIRQSNGRNDRSVSLNTRKLIPGLNSGMTSLNHTITHEISYDKDKISWLKRPNTIQRAVNLKIVNHNVASNKCNYIPMTPRGEENNNSTSYRAKKHKHKKCIHKNIIRNRLSPANLKVINHKHHLTEHAADLKNSSKKVVKKEPIKDMCLTLKSSHHKELSPSIKTMTNNKIKPFKAADPETVSISFRGKTQNVSINTSKCNYNYYKGSSNTPKAFNTHFNKNIKLSSDKDIVLSLDRKELYKEDNRRDKKKSNKIIRKGISINSNRGKSESTNHYLSQSSKISLLNNYFGLVNNNGDKTNSFSKNK